MRVLHLVKTAEGARWALRQVAHLVSAGIDVHVAMPEGRLEESYRSAGARTHRLDRPGSIVELPRVVKEIRGLADLIQPDLIHSHFVQTTLAARRALGRHHPTPRLFQVPGPLALESRVSRMLAVGSAGDADYWAPACEYSARLLRDSGVSPGRYSVLYYPYDEERFVPGEGGGLRPLLGLDEDGIVVGMVAYAYAPKWWVGQFRGLKGHEDLIDAMKMVRERHPSARCAIVGGPWRGAERYWGRVRRHARSRCGEFVHFTGYREDVAQLYDDFDVAVHPSHTENLGGAVESLAKGVPTIATTVGGFPDIIIPGKTGWLVPPRKPRALADAICEVLADPHEGRRRAGLGRALVASLLDSKRLTEQLLGIYEAILSGRALGEATGPTKV